MTDRFLTFVSAMMAAACLVLSLAAHSQAYPSKPLRMIVPYAPGGIDPFARVMMPKMVELLGQPIVLENRPGANGMIGSEIVARAAPDGYTILFVTSSTVVGGVFLIKDVRFDPVKDLTPISLMFEPTHVVATPASFPVNSMKELVAYAKRNPGKISYGSSGIGSIFHLNGELLRIAADIDIVHVPYRGSAPLATELLAGRVELAFPALNNMRPFLGSGKVKLLAVAEPKRLPSLPTIPTVAETFPGFQKAPSWIAMFGPSGLSREIVDRLHHTIAAALNAPEVRKFHDDNGSQILADTPERLSEKLKADLEKVGRLIRQLNIQAE
jgi:tripartite-type tricarboxylate transporter receptor subunit TctC